MTAPLAGKVAIVTGASSGIGEAAAIALAAAGAKVAVSARRDDRLQALCGRIAADGGEATGIAADVAVQADCDRVFARTIERFGQVDILVNSAGLIRPGLVADADIAVWRELMDINFFGTLYMCRATIEHMRGRGGGDIINISSTAGRRAGKVFNPYSASKFALNAMSEGMRQELGNDAIRVCVIGPGATTTEVAESIPDEKVREVMRSHVNKVGAMKPEDVAQAITFVASLPARCNISEMIIRPTIDTAAM